MGYHFYGIVPTSERRELKQRATQPQRLDGKPGRLGVAGFILSGLTARRYTTAPQKEDITAMCDKSLISSNVLTIARDTRLES